MSSLLPLVVLFTSVVSLCSASTQKQYYVAPSPNTTCPGDPCLTISEYIQEAEQYFTVDAIFQLLPGDHLLDEDIYIGNISSFSLIGSNAIDSQVSRIFCTRPSQLWLVNITEVNISGLRFVFCGGVDTYDAVISADSIKILELTNCSFIKNINSVLFVSDVEYFTVTSCLFQDTDESALITLSSSGAIESSNFTGNQASIYGGGIMAYDSKITIVGSTFSLNRAAENGGAITASDCELTIVDSKYSMNTAVVDGGAFSVVDTVLHFQDSTFDNNVAKGVGNFLYGGGHGGGIDAAFSRVTFTGNNVFTNNTAQGIFASSGGAIYLTFCTVHFNGSNFFVANSAKPSGDPSQSLLPTLQSGGGLQVESSNVTFNGSTVFKHNTAVLNGGGVYIGNSTAKFAGSTVFEKNQQGGLWVQNSIIHFTDSTVFKGNSAITGGGVSALGSTVYFSGNTSFIGNTASLLGGGFAAMKDDVLHPLKGSLLNDNIATPEPSIVINTGNLTLENNTAPNGGGINVGSSNISSVGKVAFRYNSATIGSALSLLNANVTLAGDNTFIRNTALGFGDSAVGAISISFSSLTFRENTLITGNLAQRASGIYAVSSDITFEGDTEIINNLAHTAEGGGVTVIGGTFTTKGNCTFLNNSAATKGGAIHAVNSIVSLTGNSQLIGNSAVEGGALSLEYSSQLSLKSPLTLHFERNTAERGAAIHITDTSSSAGCSNLAQLPYLVGDVLLIPCFFVPDASFPNVQLIFENNSASDISNVLYGGFINRCKPPQLEDNGIFDNLIPNIDIGDNVFDKILPNNDAISMFNQLSQLSDSSPVTESEVSSDPIQVCICINDASNCASDNVTLSTVRGEKFTISVIALNQVGKAVPASIRAELLSDTGSNAEFGELQSIQQIDSKCTDLQYSLFSPDVSEEFVLYAEGPCGSSGTAGRAVKVDFLPCPDGFELSLSQCICELDIQKFTNTCHINDRTIQRHGDFWFGPQYDNKSYNGMIVHPHCPFDYCISEITSIQLNESDKQCAFNRSAILCGSCQENLSLILGSSKCQECSNVYLTLLIPFAIAGVVLVIILILLKLTVAIGTINGLVFYANIVAVNRSIFFPSSNPLTIFISWLNLDLGIETCFFDGMDSYGKVWLQFVFPIYLWIMVGFITVAAYYSGRVARIVGRNPVSVLATVFFLSYAKILRTIIAALYFDNQLEYPDGTRATVWLYDGNTRYLKGKHIPLFLFALLALLVLFLPYTLVLLLGQWIQKSNKNCFRWIGHYKVKPIVDAYHAPYNDNCRYWTGFLLLLRCALFLISAFNALGDPGVNLLTIASATLGLAILTRHIGPIYKTSYLNILESSFILNLGLLAAATYHVNQAGGSQEAVVYTSVGVAFIEFVGIIVYHIYLQVRNIRCQEYSAVLTNESFNSVQDIALQQAPLEQPTVPTVSYFNNIIRESLLEPDQDLEV